jgi:hypothetical protein
MSFLFVINTVNSDDKEYNTKLLHADNRVGIFPVSLNMVARETGKTQATGKQQ